jgi:hypothetical protein
MRFLILIAAFTCTAVHAETPEEVIRSYMARVKAEGLGGVAGLMHPEDLAKFQTMMRPVIDEALQEKQGRSVFGRFAEKTDETKQRELTREEFMSVFLQCIEGIQPQISEALKASSVEVLGHVKEADVSHVVTRFRTKLQGLEMEKMTVMSTRDYQGTAKMMLSGEVKQMAELLRARRK